MKDSPAKCPRCGSDKRSARLQILPKDHGGPAYPCDGYYAVNGKGTFDWHDAAALPDSREMPGQRRWDIEAQLWFRVLDQHWLQSIECNHEKKTDQALCYCGWRGAECLTVGTAVKTWIHHIGECAAASAPSGNAGSQPTGKCICGLPEADPCHSKSHAFSGIVGAHQYEAKAEPALESPSAEIQKAAHDIYMVYIGKTSDSVTVANAVEQSLVNIIDRSIAPLRERMEKAEGELRAVDEALARRPALDDVKYRYLKVELACTVAGRADKAESELTTLRSQTKELAEALTVALALLRGVVAQNRKSVFSREGESTKYALHKQVDEFDANAEAALLKYRESK
jgi:hypothetical protein